jgi:hypothetical protein
VSTKLDDDVVVFRLACLTVDLERRELSALKRVARRLTRQWNKRTVTNAAHLERYGPIDLVSEIPRW